MQVTASHILVSDLETATALKQQINEGADFAELARQYSSCPSKENGGNLGSFGRKQMVEEFETAAFNAEVGSVTDPVRTAFGYHLIHRTA